MRLWVLTLLIFVFIAIGGVVGMLAGRDPGYVLIAYDNQSIETSLWLALILVFVGFALLVVTGIVLWRLLRSHVALGRWSNRRQTELAAEHTSQGMLLIHEAEWSEAKRLLGAAAPQAPVPLLNYLAAARAAHQLGERKERDRFLVLAERSQKGADFGVQLAQAEMLTESAEWPAALTLLETLKSRAPRHPRVLSLLARAYVSTGRWQALAQLLPGMRKARAISNSWVDSLTIRAACAELNALDDSPEARRERERLWKRLPKTLYRDPTLVLALARCAERQAELDYVAEQIDYTVSALIKDEAAAAAAAEPLQELVGAYGSTTVPASREREARLRSWLNCRTTAAPAQLALARLRILQGDSKTARELLEGVGDLTLAAEQRTARTAALELARLYLAQGEDTGAATVLERGFKHLRPVGMSAIERPRTEPPAASRLAAETATGPESEPAAPEPAERKATEPEAVEQEEAEGAPEARVDAARSNA
ncbi:MAG: heme biosynthesis HemY N-terminal domain-containing protein [Pseudomonadota bacterium]